MTVASSLLLQDEVARPAVVVLGDPSETHQRAARLLHAAGFQTALEYAGEAEDSLVLLVSEDTSGARLKHIRAVLAGSADVRLIVTMPRAATGAQLRRAVQSGVAGIVMDDEIERTLTATVRAVAVGQLAFPPGLRRHVAPKSLSHREKEVMTLAARGFTNRQIAVELFLSESTVKTHLSTAFSKLDVASRAEAAALMLARERSQA